MNKHKAKENKSQEEDISNDFGEEIKGKKRSQIIKKKIQLFLIQIKLINSIKI